MPNEIQMQQCQDMGFVFYYYLINLTLPPLHLNLAVAKKRSKREMSVLENLYSGTFSLLVTLFPSILQKSPQVTSHVTHKTLKNPHWKGLEVHSSLFSMQR
jgi:hypothetical protein